MNLETLIFKYQIGRLRNDAVDLLNAVAACRLISISGNQSSKADSVKMFAVRQYLSVFIALMIISVLATLAVLSHNANIERQWQPQFQRLPKISMAADEFTVADVRDFRYRFNEQQKIVVSEYNYLQKSYQFSNLKNSWFAISHFSGLGLAHVFLSFEFTNNQPLVISVEARLTKDDDSYDPIKGLFRSFTKMLVIATEQDVIGLRTHLRHEPTYFYPLQLSMDRQKDLLKNLLLTADKLNSEAAFYNSIFDNCMTGLLKELELHEPMLLFDYRIILPGYSDQLALQKNILRISESVQTIYDLRQQALISSDGYGIDDPMFSDRIRQNYAH